MKVLCGILARLPYGIDDFRSGVSALVRNYKLLEELFYSPSFQNHMTITLAGDRLRRKHAISFTLPGWQLLCDGPQLDGGWEFVKTKLGLLNKKYRFSHAEK